MVTHFVVQGPNGPVYLSAETVRKVLGLTEQELLQQIGETPAARSDNK